MVLNQKKSTEMPHSHIEKESHDSFQQKIVLLLLEDCLGL